MRLLFDENFDHHIIRGLKIRVPGLDFIEVTKIGFRGYEDPKLLEWAAGENRLLVTHDAETMTKFAYDRVLANLPMPGVILVPDLLSIGEAVEELLIVIECSSQDEYENQVLYIPL